MSPAGPWWPTQPDALAALQTALAAVGVTHRTLRASGPSPGPSRGDTSPVTLHGPRHLGQPVVGCWVRTAPGVRPVVAHAAWRTDAAAAAAVVLACCGHVRTPEPLRRARQVAREARAQAEVRGVSG